MASDITPGTAALLWARERALYDVVYEDRVVGAYSVELRPRQDAGKLDLVAAYEDSGLKSHAELTLEPETLFPLSARKRIQTAQGTYEIAADYGESLLKLRADTPDGPQKLELPLPERVFDNDSVLTVIRALPLAPGYRGTAEVANIDNGRTYFAWVERIGQEAIGGPEKSSECHHVKLTFDNAESHELWYALDPPHSLLRYDNRSVLFDLRELSRESV